MQELGQHKVSMEELNFKELPPHHRKLAQALVESLIEEDASIRAYAVEANFIDICNSIVDATDSKPLFMLIQEELMKIMSREQIAMLVAKLPKGLKIEFSIETYANGLNLYTAQLAHRLVNEYGLYTIDPKADSQDSSSYSKLAEQQQAEYMQAQFDQTQEIKITKMSGIIEAEEMQGYSKDGIRIKNEDGSEESIDPLTVKSFKILGLSEDRADLVRRPREIYPGRPVQIWDKYHKQWINGKIGEYRDLNYVTVVLDDEIFLPTILDQDKKTKIVRVNIGIPFAHMDENVTFPPIGSAPIETSIWQFKDINLDLDYEGGEIFRNPYVEVPEVFRVNNIILFKDGTIGKVIHTSEQGYSRVDGINGKLSSKIIDWSKFQDSDMPTELKRIDQTIESDKLGFIITGTRVRSIVGNGNVINAFRKSIKGQKDSALNALTRKVVKFSEKFKVKQDNILRVEGLFQDTNGKEVVVLERLNGRDESGYVQVSVEEYLELISTTFETQIEKPLASLKGVFPERVIQEILDNVDEIGNVRCSISLKTKKTYKAYYADFSTLPFGITLNLDKGQSILINPQDIETLEVTSNFEEEGLMNILI